MEWSNMIPSGTLQSSNSICTTFQTFQNNLVGLTVASITISSDFGTGNTFTCSDSSTATSIATALSTCMNSGCQSQAFICNGNTWRVGGCGGGEINVSSSYGICNCAPSSASTSHLSIRPCINNLNWGGLGDSCGASTQTLSISVTTA